MSSATGAWKGWVHGALFGGSDSRDGKGRRVTGKAGKGGDGKAVNEEEEVPYFGRDSDIEGLGIGRTAVIVSKKSRPIYDNVDAAPIARHTFTVAAALAAHG